MTSAVFLGRRRARIVVQLAAAAAVTVLLGGCSRSVTRLAPQVVSSKVFDAGALRQVKVVRVNPPKIDRGAVGVWEADTLQPLLRKALLRETSFDVVTAGSVSTAASAAASVGHPSFPAGPNNQHRVAAETSNSATNNPELNNSEHGKIDAELLTTMTRLRERVGSEGGAVSGAECTFRQKLRAIPSGRILWEADFSFSDQSVTDNLLQVHSGRWLSLSEVIRGGFQKTARALEQETTGFQPTTRTSASNSLR